MKYGLYSNTVERFLLVDDQLHFVYDTARLLSSKMLCHVLPLKSHSPVTEKNCHYYKVSNPSSLLQKSPYPHYTTKLVGQDMEVKTTKQTAVPEEVFDQHIEFVICVHALVTALYHTEYEVPGNYVDLLPETPDDFFLTGGFKQVLFDIAYNCLSREELYEALGMFLGTIPKNNPYAMKKKDKFVRFLKKYEQRFLSYSL